MGTEHLLREPGHHDRVGEVRQRLNADLLGPVLTVGELIDRLRDLDPALPILLPAGEGGLASAAQLEQLPVQLDVNSLDGFGPHDTADSAGEADLVAVVLRPLPASR